MSDSFPWDEAVTFVNHVGEAFADLIDAVSERDLRAAVDALTHITGHSDDLESLAAHMAAVNVVNDPRWFIDRLLESAPPDAKEAINGLLQPVVIDTGSGLSELERYANGG